MQQKSERKENPAVLYRSKSKSGETMFAVNIKAAELPEPDEKGIIRLIGFVNSYKTKEQHPDVLFYLPKNGQGGGKKTIRQKSTPQSSEKAGSDDWF